ncbi:hypothetical protein AP071_07055 [Rhodobacter capsulatus]|nr:hypothetical protein AP071_07055 [Rhodobacter capsulatus]KQB16692.1 hypothetical protein AP073_10380 [Rhodobacter capsulatus]
MENPGNARQRAEVKSKPTSPEHGASKAFAGQGAGDPLAAWLDRIAHDAALPPQAARVAIHVARLIRAAGTLSVAVPLRPISEALAVSDDLIGKATYAMRDRGHLHIKSRRGPHGGGSILTPILPAGQGGAQ